MNGSKLHTQTYILTKIPNWDHVWPSLSYSTQNLSCHRHLHHHHHRHRLTSHLFLQSFRSHHHQSPLQVFVCLRSLSDVLVFNSVKKGSFARSSLIEQQHTNHSYKNIIIISLNTHTHTHTRTHAIRQTVAKLILCNCHWPVVTSRLHTCISDHTSWIRWILYLPSLTYLWLVCLVSTFFLCLFRTALRESLPRQ